MNSPKDMSTCPWPPASACVAANVCRAPASQAALTLQHARQPVAATLAAPGRQGHVPTSFGAFLVGAGRPGPAMGQRAALAAALRAR